MKRFFQTLLVALVSAASLSFIFTVISFMNRYTEEMFSFAALFSTVFILCLPIYILFGIPTALISRFLMKKPIFHLLTYIIVAIIVTVPYAQFLFNASTVGYFSIIAACAATLFWGLQWAFEKIFPNFRF